MWDINMTLFIWSNKQTDYSTFKKISISLVFDYL